MNATTCREHIDAPRDCPHETFESADGSTRCRGCHLHPDLCTCGPKRRENTFRAMGLLVDIEDVTR